MDVKKIERKCIERNSKDRIVIDIKRDKKNGRQKVKDRKEKGRGKIEVKEYKRKRNAVVRKKLQV